MNAAETTPVLVTGATGRHGSTGRHLVSRLLDEGHAVRVLARSRGARTQALSELGADVVIGDLHDRRSLVAALTGVDLAYFTYPVAAGVVEAAANYAAAVREVGGAPRTVVMSMGPAQHNHPSDLGRAQWLAEEIMQWGGLDLTILRIAALFHENLAVLHAESIGDRAVLRNCFGDAEMAWISAEDAAELSRVALLEPRRFTAGVNYVAGSESYSHQQVAEMLSDLIGRAVTFEAIDRDQWRAELLELSDVDGQTVVNPAMAQHISAIGHAVAAQGASSLPADPARLTELLGRPPRTLRGFLAANRSLFAPTATP
jgi:uncharacterized protein YbjT (DUF2867 family)